MLISFVFICDSQLSAISVCPANEQFTGILWRYSPPMEWSRFYCSVGRTIVPSSCQVVLLAVSPYLVGNCYSACYSVVPTGFRQPEQHLATTDRMSVCQHSWSTI